MNSDLKKRKQEIVGRLVEKGDISFEEALLLMETEKEVQYIPNPVVPYIPSPNDTTCPWEPIITYYGDLNITSSDLDIDKKR